MNKRKILIIVIVAFLCLLGGLIVQLCFFSSKGDKKNEETSNSPKEFKELDIKVTKEVQFQGLEFSNFQIRTCKEEQDGSCEINLDNYTFEGKLNLDVEHPSVLTINFKNPNETTVAPFDYEVVLYNQKKKIIVALFGKTNAIEGNAEGFLRILTPVDLSEVKDYKLQLKTQQ